MMGSLFNFGDEDDAFGLKESARPPIKPAVQWADAQRLERERELVGMYLSAHPLDPYYMELKYGTKTSIKDLEEITPAEDLEVTFGGMVTSYETKPTRKGGTFGILKLEDYTGSTELRLFGQQIFDFGRYGIPGTPIYVKCRYRRRFRDNPELSFDVVDIRPLESVKGQLIKGISIRLQIENAKTSICDILKDFIAKPGDQAGLLTVRLYDPSIDRAITLSSKKRMRIDRKLISTLESLDIDFSVQTY